MLMMIMMMMMVVVARMMMVIDDGVDEDGYLLRLRALQLKVGSIVASVPSDLRT